ncbi:hypothetical protein MCOR17_008843 [Pyricularia oryzae]|nr:hypothetical protein MCOR17_008843 [Pyricularia oryzae]
MHVARGLRSILPKVESLKGDDLVNLQGIIKLAPLFGPLRLHKRHTTAKGDSRKHKADRLAEQPESRILTSFRQASGASPQPSPAYRAQFMVFTRFQQLGHVKIPTKIVSTGAVIFAPLQELGLLWRAFKISKKSPRFVRKVERISSKPGQSWKFGRIKHKSLQGIRQRCAHV